MKPSSVVSNQAVRKLHAAAQIGRGEFVTEVLAELAAQKTCIAADDIQRRSALSVAVIADEVTLGHAY